MSSHSTVIFWLLFAAIFIIIAFCDLKFGMLRDASTANPRPYSWSRVQLAWWTLIVLTSFITIIICYTGHQIPTLDSSTLVLLGITTGTTATATLIDVSAQKNATNPALLSQNYPGENFFLDILSDNNGVSLNRLQAVIFNFVFGIWFINYVIQNWSDPCPALYPAVADCSRHAWDYIMPVISQNNLILLGLSSATYAVLKTTENANLPATPSNNQPPPPQTNP